MKNPLSEKSLHPRNRHTGRYNFDQLIKANPELSKYTTQSPRGESTIDFANTDAVKSLNRALLKSFYEITSWDIPNSYLCPPIPGRADYIHHISDLLASCNHDEVPQGDSIKALDIGVGANCIYPIIGRYEYGWNFVGTDTDAHALASATKIVSENKILQGGVDLRIQPAPSKVLNSMIRPDEKFDVVICNPPFHSSLEEAQAGSRRKWNNLGKSLSKNQNKNPPKLNFGGQSSELWCPGGELEFVRKMIDESIEYSSRIFCFSSLISKEANLLDVYNALKKAGVRETLTIEMSQGQKRSRIIAWTFLSGEQIDQWREQRWAG